MKQEIKVNHDDFELSSIMKQIKQKRSLTTFKEASSY